MATIAITYNEVFFRIKVILSVVFLVFCIFILIFFFFKRSSREEKRQIKQLKKNLINLYLIEKKLRENNKGDNKNDSDKKDKDPIFQLPIYYVFVLFAKICRYKEDSEAVLYFGRKVVREGVVIKRKFFFRLYTYEVPGTTKKFEVFFTFTGFAVLLREKTDNNQFL